MSDAFTPISLFAFPLYASVISGHERHNPPLLAHILDLASKHPGRTRSNRNAWHSAEEFATSRDGTGTNAALFVSPARIAMDYGENRLTRHLARAANAGFRTDVVRMPGMEFDVVTPEDLRLFRDCRATNSEAWRFVDCL